MDNTCVDSWGVHRSGVPPDERSGLVLGESSDSSLRGSDFESGRRARVPHHLCVEFLDGLVPRPASGGSGAVLVDPLFFVVSPVAWRLCPSVGWSTCRSCSSDRSFRFLLDRPTSSGPTDTLPVRPWSSPVRRVSLGVLGLRWKSGPFYSAKNGSYRDLNTCIFRNFVRDVVSGLYSLGGRWACHSSQDSATVHCCRKRLEVEIFVVEV